MAKYNAIVGTLERRIQNGDYLVRQFPSYAELATELQVNPRTIGKALNELVRQGALVRLPTGRIAVPATKDKTGLHLGLLAPAFPTPWISRWHRAFERLVEARGWQIKLIGYTHWHDTTIFDALRGLDGICFLPLGGDFPQDVLRHLKNSERPVVVLEQDVTSHGLPVLRFQTPSSIQSLLSALDLSKHPNVACLNAQPEDSVIRERIQHWQLWTQAHGQAGPLIDEPAVLFDSPFEQAHQVMTRRLESPQGLGADTLFCTTGATALGAMRALADHGLRPGHDVLVCAADDHAGAAEYFIPSLTCLKDPNWDPYLQVCLDWFARGGHDWMGPLLVQPTEVSVFLGESTHPERFEAARARATAKRLSTRAEPRDEPRVASRPKRT